MRRTGVLIWILWMGLFGFTSCTVRSKAGNDRETEIDEIQLLVFEEGGI